MLLVLLIRILLFAAIALTIRYVFTKAIPQKHIAWRVGILLVAILTVSFTLPDDVTIQSLWELFSFPLTPLGASLILIGLSLGNSVSNLRPQPAALALAILLFSSTPLSARLLVSQLEDIPGNRDLATAVAIVV